MLTDEFFEEVTEELFYGTLPEFQKTPLEKLYDEASKRGLSKEQLAYMYATTYWETDRYKTNHEYGYGNGRPYGEPTLLIRGRGEKYYGRGLVQLTWLTNYAKMSVAATLHFEKEIDLVNDPNLLIRDWDINAFVAFEGALQGIFTGKKLGDYINDSKCDYINARRVINGTDKAAKIAAIAEKFENALRDVDMNGVKNGRSEEKPFRFRR